MFCDWENLQLHWTIPQKNWFITRHLNQRNERNTRCYLSLHTSFDWFWKVVLVNNFRVLLKGPLSICTTLRQWTKIWNFFSYIHSDTPVSQQYRNTVVTPHSQFLSLEYWERCFVNKFLSPAHGKWEMRLIASSIRGKKGSFVYRWYDKISKLP